MPWTALRVRKVVLFSSLQNAVLPLKKKIKTKTGNKIISNIETNKQKKKIYINIIYTIQHKQKLPGKIFPLG